MAESFTLHTDLRTITGKKVKRLRQQQLVPLCLYGNRVKPRNLQADYRALEVVLLNAGGTNLIELQVEDEPFQVLAREVQRDPIRGTIQHVDFFAVDMNVRVTLDVPIVYEGESPAVATLGAMLLLGANVLTIETLPSHLPDQITVDLTGLEKIGDSLSVGDLVLDEVIEVQNNPDETLVSVTQSAAARGDEEEDEDGEALELEGDEESTYRPDEEEAL